MKKWVYTDEKAKRLDLFLSACLPDFSRRQLQKSIGIGDVSVNGKKVKKDYLLRNSDIVTLSTTPENSREQKPLANAQIHVNRIYEDADIVVVEKPGFMPTRPLSKDKNNSLLNGLIAVFPDLEGVGDGGLQSGVVHRLDNDTSGLLVFARTDQAFVSLREQFKENLVKKEYVILVHGILFEDGELVDELAHHKRSKKRMITVALNHRSFRGKRYSARLEYALEDTFLDYTLLRVTLHTGVMHQIRVQFSSAGHPVAGDLLYNKTNTESGVVFPRHFVHANILGFNHPVTGNWREFSSPLPPDLLGVLEQMKSR